VARLPPLMASVMPTGKGGDKVRSTESSRRLVQVILATVAGALLLAVSRATWPVKVTTVALGIAIGCWLGLLSWRRLRRQILANTVLVTYLEDSLWAAVLLVLYLGSFAPRVFVYTFNLLAVAPGVGWLASLAVASSCTGYSWVLYRSIRSHERLHGRLRVKTIYARSVAGAEGLVGRQAVVVEPCDPDGRVTVGPELWFARSITGVAISVGTAVVVREVEGLRLIVEKPTGQAA